MGDQYALGEQRKHAHPRLAPLRRTHDHGATEYVKPITAPPKPRKVSTIFGTTIEISGPDPLTKLPPLALSSLTPVSTLLGPHQSREVALSNFDATNMAILEQRLRLLVIVSIAANRDQFDKKH